MDEAMGDGAMDPGPFQQRNTPAIEPEGTVAESMNESMDGPEQHGHTHNHGHRSSNAKQQRNPKKMPKSNTAKKQVLEILKQKQKQS